MNRKTVRRIAALPTSLLIGVVVYYAILWQNGSHDQAEIWGVGTFVVSIICFFGGMNRPAQRRT